MANVSAPYVVIGSGQLGKAVASVLLARGESVALLNRSGRRPSGLPDNVNVIGADATDPDAVARACDGAQVVFHWLSGPAEPYDGKYQDQPRGPVLPR